jgi:hypothetical protein
MGELKRIYGHWKNVSKVVVALRFFKNKGDNGSSFGIRYYLTSKALMPEEFGEAVRGHWCFENNMYW